VIARKCRAIGKEDGATMVEMAISFSVLLAMLFLIIQVSFVLYDYNAVSEAAREASRYAAVRGAQSCLVLSTFPDCNLSKASSGNPLQTYIQGLGYPMSSQMNVTASWYSPSVDNNGSTTWPTANVCTTVQDTNQNYCNQRGNQVTVVVTLSVPVKVPFVTSSLSIINLSSTSSMVIVE
jgi:Flp pilus assembly protein TadG